MTKEETLAAVALLAAQHTLTKDELLAAYGQGAGQSTDTLEKKLDIAQILYYLGGAVVVLGIAIFIGQNWSTLSFMTKVLATLGSGVAAYVVGALLGASKRLEGMAAAFFLIAAFTLPVGLYVIFDNAGWQMYEWGPMSVVAGILFAIFLASLLLMGGTVHALFSIIFGTALFYTFTNYLVLSNPYFDTDKFNQYRTLLSGVTYLLLAYTMARGAYAGLTSFLYAAGTLGTLGAAFVLGGWSPNQNALWELSFPLLVFGALYLSVYVRSQGMLLFGTLFLMAYILKITGEYFSEGLGWPLALVIAGLLMIGVGYLSLNINKRYLKA